MSKSWTVAGEPMTVGRYPLKNVIPIARDGAVIAHVNCAFGETAARQEARLIVAAPELLRFAEQFIEWVAEHAIEFDEDVLARLERQVELAKDVLAKVRP